MRNIYTPFALTAILLLSSCANYKMHLQGEQFQPEPTNLGQPEHIMYLIGDAGDADLDEVPPAVKFLGKKLKEAPKNSSVVFLGDNIYKDGMPGKKSKKRALAEHRIDVQLDILKDFKGKPYFLAGEKDWTKKNPRKGLEREEDYIQDKLDKGNVFRPGKGCSGPDMEELSDNVTAMFVDSEWYRMNWLREKELNEGCDVKSREVFDWFLLNEFKAERRKNIVVLMHHPLYSNGEHGGRFTVKQHIFPLTELPGLEKLYIPLPLIGTVSTFLRMAAGSTQDNSHPNARALKHAMESNAVRNGEYIFVGSHDQSLQYIQAAGQHHIVSGAGSKTSPVGNGKGMQFGYGKEQGFSILKFYPEGEVYLEMWTANPDGEDGKLVFSRQIKGKLPLYESKLPTGFPEFEAAKDSVTLALNPAIKNKPVHNFFWGAHYRKAYVTPIKVPVLDLSKFQGGLTPVKRGGGGQTNSLRAVDTKGREWVVRDMLKDESRTLPYPYNETFAKDVFADQFTAANPFAAFVVPKLADAVNVYHTNPRLFYMPKQPKLGDYNDQYGGSIYLVEERAGDGWGDLASFGNSDELISTFDVQEKLQKDHKYRFDGPWTVRSRIFDNLLGDWDRHGDNWRWAEFKDKKKDIVMYRPVPRDRDQPFSLYDGLLPGIIRHTVPFARQLRIYKKNVDNIKWQNYNSKYFDPYFLNQNDWSVWEKEAKFIQDNLTDTVIDHALQDFPPEAYQMFGHWVADRLKGRRDNLVDIARELYLLVSKKVDIIGTNDQDYFEVERLDDEHTRVRMYASNKQGEKKELVYDRTFLTSETKEIHLYGLDQEDRFHITGNVNKGILIRCIGGLDDDYFTDESKVGGLCKKTKVYDTKDENHLSLGSEAANRTSNDPVMNTYDDRSWDTEHNFGLGFPFVAGNPDDGLALGGGYVYTTYGFKKSPFSTKHTISGKFAFETKGFDITYAGEYLNALGKWDVLALAKIQGPLYTRNYFGFGNDSPFVLGDDGKGEDYVRVRQQLYGAYPSLRRRFGENFSLSLGGTAEFVEIEDTKGRLVNKDSLDAKIRKEVFDGQVFGGGELQLNFINLDNPVAPTQGITFNASAGWKTNLEETDRSFGYFGGSLGIYIGNKRIVVASLVGARHATGDAEFYQAPTLGARTNLRGYRNERYTGNTVFFHQNDVRLRLFTLNNYIMPFSLGILGGYDYGRVWSDKVDEPDDWHNAYGGGLWLSPFNLAVLNFSIFESDDGLRFEFRGAFAF
ncbi:MAG: hypothetical protein R2830_23155 [Saprospiraceae bacterium]